MLRNGNGVLKRMWPPPLSDLEEKLFLGWMGIVHVGRLLSRKGPRQSARPTDERDETVRSDFSKLSDKISFMLGIALVLLGLLINQYSLGWALAGDGEIDLLKFKILIVVFQLLMIGTGVYIVFRRPKAANLLLMLVSIFVGVISVEICFHLLDISPGIMSGWRYVGFDSEKNQLGFRGQPIEYSGHDFVAVLLGDSQVEADALPYTAMPESRLEAQLASQFKASTKVFSLGANGYGQDQQLLALKEYYRKFRADLVLLWLTPSNDVWNNLFPTHWPANGAPKPTFWLEDGKLCGPTQGMGDPISCRPGGGPATGFFESIHGHSAQLPV